MSVPFESPDVGLKPALAVDALLGLDRRVAELGRVPGQRLALRAVAGAAIDDRLQLPDRGRELLAAQQAVAVVLDLVLLDHRNRAGLAPRAQARQHECLHGSGVLQALDRPEVDRLVLGGAAYAARLPVEAQRDVAVSALRSVVEFIADG